MKPIPSKEINRGYVNRNLKVLAKNSEKYMAEFKSPRDAVEYSSPKNVQKNFLHPRKLSSIRKQANSVMDAFDNVGPDSIHLLQNHKGMQNMQGENLQ